MKVVIFGAAGWTGRAVLANLQGRHQVRAFDAGPQSWKAWTDIDGSWDGEVVHGDIVDFAAVVCLPARLHQCRYAPSKHGVPWRTPPFRPAQCSPVVL